MPLTSSTYSADAHAQADGARYVRQSHTDHDGKVHGVMYSAPDGTDNDALLAQHAAGITAIFAAFEYRRAIRQVAAIDLDWNTPAQFAARLEQDWRSRTKAERCELSHWLIEMLTAAHVTDAQVRNAFGMTANQWNTLKANKIQPEHDAWAAVLVAEGE